MSVVWFMQVVPRIYFEGSPTAVPNTFRAPLQERADYVDEIMPLVLDSADKPFDVCHKHFPAVQ